MSYNTRRNTPNYGTPQHQQASSVGQRRPAATNNFVSGGQLSGSQQQKPQGQQTPQRSQQQPYRSQTPQVQSQQNYQSQNYSGSQQQQGRYQQGQQTPTVKSEPVAKPVQQQQPKAPVTPTPAPAPAPTPAPAPAPAPAQNTPDADPQLDEQDENMDETTDEQSPKRKWFKGKGRISKAEKVRRRNLKLSKILQPKNAVMILNELVRGCVYKVDETDMKVDANQFRATVSFDDQEFAGTGRTKIGAKNAAAETALKHLVKNKQLGAIKKEDGDEKMEIVEEEGSQVMPWSHIASFAMYKLFSTWGEDPNLVNKVNVQDIISGAASPNKTASQQSPKPAKKMPENPETLNPLMLMHQMLPHAVWQEVGKSGNPPDVVFTFIVSIDDKKFTGTGPSKKIAKRMASFAACHELLKVTYPPDVWAPSF